jgi:hypothetical protein
MKEICQIKDEKAVLKKVGNNIKYVAPKPKLSIAGHFGAIQLSKKTNIDSKIDSDVVNAIVLYCSKISRITFDLVFSDIVKIIAKDPKWEHGNDFFEDLDNLTLSKTMEKRLKKHVASLIFHPGISMSLM